MKKGIKRQPNASKAEMIDSYRNAPPHQVRNVALNCSQLHRTIYMCIAN